MENLDLHHSCRALLTTCVLDADFVLSGSSTIGLGQPVKLGGLSRWSVDNISIFDVEAGRKMAATPRREPSIFEIKRAAAIEKAATETPLVGKYRLYPRLSPGRAFFWGTMAALTGTMIGTKMACLVLDIKSVKPPLLHIRMTGGQSVQMDEVAGKMKTTLEPLRSFMESTFTPVNGAVRQTIYVPIGMWCENVSC